MKILFGMVNHESNTFSCKRTTFDMWAATRFAEGDDIFPRYEGTPVYPAGMINAARERGVELIPTVTVAEAGPLIAKDALDDVMGRLLPVVERHKAEIDGICIGLHGAGAAEGAYDLEAYILRCLRDIVGSDMPITVALDLHGNITREMVELSNGLFGVKEYPHLDQHIAGYNAMNALIDIINGERMDTALVPLPMFVPPINGCTLEPPMKEFTDYVKDYAAKHGLVDASFFHGFPYTDFPGCRASVVVVAREGAQRAAQDIARYIWDNRAKLDAHPLSADEAIDRALEELKSPGEGYIVINEASDNPGGGCPADGTHLLRALIERDVPRSIIGYIVDPKIARAAHAAGVGGRISGDLGGKTEPLGGKPVDISDALVVNLSDGESKVISPMMTGNIISLGKTARLRVGRVEIIVVERLCGQVLDDRVFQITGADITQYDIVCVKSTNHFKGFFKPRAKAIVAADPPGIHTANFWSLTYHNIQHPMYPLDSDAQLGQDMV